MHQFFTNAFSAFVRHDQPDWDVYLPALIDVYQDSIHESLGGYSPSQVMIGRTLGSPLTFRDTPEVRDQTTQGSKSLYVQRLKLALDRAQKDLSLLIHKKRLENRLPSLGREIIPVKEGDKVGISVESFPDEFPGKKLFPRYRGPYTVIKSSNFGLGLYVRDNFSFVL